MCPVVWSRIFVVVLLAMGAPVFEVLSIVALRFIRHSVYRVSFRCDVDMLNT